MREETQLEPICAICKQPITQQQRPSTRLKSGEPAHLACYLDHPNDDEKKSAP